RAGRKLEIDDMTLSLDASVITATYNSQSLLVDAIRSVSAQADVRYEHIVVDDGSTDQTRTVLSRMAQDDPRLIPVFLPENVGPIRARNAALNRARGRFLAFLDA